MEKTITLKRGGLWESNTIELKFDYPIPIYKDECNCPHLGEKYSEYTKSAWGEAIEHVYAKCPIVIVAENEAGCNDTGVCYQCVVEQYNEYLKNVEKQ